MPPELKDQVLEILLQISNWDIQPASFDGRPAAKQVVLVAKTYRSIRAAKARAARETVKLEGLVQDYYTCYSEPTP